MPFETSNVNELFSRIKADHVSQMNTVVTKFANHIATDLKSRSGVDTVVEFLPRPESNPGRSVLQAISEGNLDKLNNDEKEKLRAAQEHILKSIKEDSYIAWRLTQIGVY